GFGDAFELLFALQVQKNCRLFDVAAFQYAFDDFIAVQRLTSLFQYIRNHVSDSSLLVSPFFQGINTTANQNETVVFNKLVVNRLSRNVFAFEARLLYGVSDF